MPLDRRRVLTAVGGALAGYLMLSHGRPGRAPATSAAPGAAAAPARSVASAAPATPAASAAAASASPSAPKVPDRAEVVARYQGAVPVGWGTDVPGVLTRLPQGARKIALTFDACGGPGGDGYDQALIDFLREREVPATLFINSRWIDANPEAFRRLAGEPLFEIGNHGTRHCPLSVTGRSAYGIQGTRDAGEVFDEVSGNRERLAELLGAPPRFFRPGTAHCDEVAVRIAAELGEQVVGFDVNGDAGATYPATEVASEVGAALPGSIVIAHMNHPEGHTAAGIAAAVPGLLAAGHTFTRLTDAFP
jgi:peptidoglycan/xylan/chitin deacetylase (PgdA/CDA1 family)